MSTYHDSNFGNWDMSEGDEMIEFYHKVQAESTEKECTSCGAIVFLRPAYTICSDCADMREIM